MNYYSYSPNRGMEYHPTSAAAKETADKALRHLVHNGGVKGPDLETITWGEVMDRVVAGDMPVFRKQVRIDYEREHPQVIDGRMENSNADLVLVKNIHEKDLMYHEMVLTIALIWKSLSGKIKRFKQYNFEEVTAALALLFEKYGVERGGRDGNMQFFTFDRRYKLNIAVQKKIDFGPELQAAEAKISQCLDELTTATESDLRTIVTAAFNLDEGKLRVSEILRLRSYKIENPLWNEAMRIIDEAIVVISSKKMMRLYERNAQGEYINVPLDIAAL
jgi:Protein of unknown function (DUF3164)